MKIKKDYYKILKKILKYRQEHMLNDEFYRKHVEIHKKQCELRKRFRELHKHRAEFHHYHRHIKFARPIFLVFNLLIWYLIFRFAGIKVISVVFAIIISMVGIFELFFLRKVERRIIRPIALLKDGVEKIAEGNYNVKVESSVTNEIGLLIDSFNEMAQKLKESEKIKTEYEENRKSLIANISHDLKTPITSVQGYIEVILDGDIASKEKINSYLKVIYNNTAYMNKLIDDLFLYSKLDMQKLEFEFIKIEAKPFMRDLMEEFKFEFEGKQINFQYEDRIENNCIINIDRKRLNQVFRNIIGNAVKYGDAYNLSLLVKLYANERCVCIDIKDNGPGISEDKLPHIFDRFYRIDSERTKDFTSTGLGLAISKELILAHSGEINVSSTLNEGTCFTIMLPVVL